MNRKCFLISLMLVLVFSISAFAGVQKFDKLSINVPDGWSASQDGSTVTVLANDKSAALTFTIEDNDGTPIKDLADAFAKQFKATEPEVDEDDTYYFTFKNPSDVDCNVILYGDDDEYLMLVMIGEHPDMEGIIDSLE